MEEKLLETEILVKNRQHWELSPVCSAYRENSFIKSQLISNHNLNVLCWWFAVKRQGTNQIIYKVFYNQKPGYIDRHMQIIRLSFMNLIWQILKNYHFQSDEHCLYIQHHWNKNSNGGGSVWLLTDVRTVCWLKDVSQISIFFK